MKPSIINLQKFFNLEASRDYDNRSVMGGFESVASSWEKEARADNIDEIIVIDICSRLKNYHQLSPDQRREVLKELWDILISAYPEQEIKNETMESAPPPDNIGIDTTTESPINEIEVEAEEIVPPLQALDSPLTVLDGIGKSTASLYQKLGLSSLRDMLYYFPRRHIDYSRLIPIKQLKYNTRVTIIGVLEKVSSRKMNSGKRKVVDAILTDGSGSIRLTWFNQPWLESLLKKQEQITASGMVTLYLGRLVMTNPEWEPLTKTQLNTNRVVPVYPLKADVSQKKLRRSIYDVVSQWAPQIPEHLPQGLIQKAKLMSLSDAMVNIHFPENWEKLEEAKHRLAFDEVFMLQMGVLSQKKAWETREAHKLEVSEEWMRKTLEILPYTLTSAQKKVLGEVRTDLSSGSPMNRLLQGDVGSGKTVIAAIAVAITASNEAQSAIMAPTSILAAQHYRNLTEFFSTENSSITPEQIRLLVGSTTTSAREEIKEGLLNGSVKLLIGTHALIEDPVIFKDLQLIVIDEQHRFGVEQRRLLREKGNNPHLMVMTATPIPRSMALTIYGDLDLSIIDELPPGRKPIKTVLLQPLERERIYSFIRSQAQEGQQTFIVYPLVEDSEKLPDKAAITEYERLQSTIFPDLQIGLLHGRMKPDDKDAVMENFRAENLDILVSTTVIEVGVDIPNATIMVIESAHRFGLAQLHQLRGRIGRGSENSYCVLIPDSKEKMENERLQVMVNTSDGFVLAEKDLLQRGPGQFFGKRQSGFREFQLSDITNVDLIVKARKLAKELFDDDPTLSKVSHAALAQALAFFWQERKTGEVS